MLKRVLGAVVLLIAGVAAGLALHVVTSTGDTMFAGKRPDYLGLKDGKLPRCKRSPKTPASPAVRSA